MTVVPVVNVFVAGFVGLVWHGLAEDDAGALALVSLATLLSPRTACVAALDAAGARLDELLDMLLDVLPDDELAAKPGLVVAEEDGAVTDVNLFFPTAAAMTVVPAVDVFVTGFVGLVLGTTFLRP